MQHLIQDMYFFKLCLKIYALNRCAKNLLKIIMVSKPNRFAIAFGWSNFLDLFLPVV